MVLNPLSTLSGLCIKAVQKGTLARWKIDTGNKLLAVCHKEAAE